MQRLFSTFPDGRPGLGLLLLRLAVGVALIAPGETWVAGRLPGVLALAIGGVGTLLLLLGFLTPVASLLAALFGLGIALGLLPAGILSHCAPAALFLLVTSLAVLLLGPGAYSLDARWFGRREIVIPPAPP